jgi:hypothetical protein
MVTHGSVSVVFVPGTGVREREYQPTYGLVKRKLEARLGVFFDDVHIQPCLWGDLFGAHQNHSGRSVPGNSEAVRFYDNKGNPLKGPIPWYRLYEQPLSELMEFAESSKARRQHTQDSFYKRLKSQGPKVKELEPILQDAGMDLKDAGIEYTYAEAYTYIVNSGACQEAIFSSQDPGQQLARPIARAIVARATVMAERAAALKREQPPAISYDVELRDDGVVPKLASRIHPTRGMVRRLTKLPRRVATDVVDTFGRRELANYLIPRIGDVLVYQLHAGRIHAAIHGAISRSKRHMHAKPGICVVLAHSLGGVLAVDAIAAKKSRKRPYIDLLVTAGHQRLSSMT